MAVEFDVYIGKRMYLGQNDKIKAIVDSKFVVPKGQCDLNGKFVEVPTVCFVNLDNLATYFCDWFDIVNKDKIKARVYLNIVSLSKVFVGEDIVHFIDALRKIGNYDSIRSFEEIV